MNADTNLHGPCGLDFVRQNKRQDYSKTLWLICQEITFAATARQLDSAMYLWLGAHGRSPQKAGPSTANGDNLTAKNWAPSLTQRPSFFSISQLAGIIHSVVTNLKFCVHVRSLLRSSIDNSPGIWRQWYAGRGDQLPSSKSWASVTTSGGCNKSSSVKRVHPCHLTCHCWSTCPHAVVWRYQKSQLSPAGIGGTRGL